jgi:hypothetical protein
MSVIYGTNKNLWIQIQKWKWYPFTSLETKKKEKKMAAKSDHYMREPDVVCIYHNSDEDEQKLLLGDGLNELDYIQLFHYYEGDTAKPYPSRGRISNFL